MESEEYFLTESKDVDRRRFLKYTGAFVAGAIVAGAGVAAYDATKPIAAQTQTVTETLTARETVTVGQTVAPPPAAGKIPLPKDLLKADWIKYARIPEDYVIKGDWSATVDWSAIKKQWGGTTITMACEGVDIAAPEMFRPYFEDLSGMKVELLGIPTDVFHEKLMAEFVAKTGRYDMAELFVDWGASYMPYMNDLAPMCRKYGVRLEDYHPVFRMLATTPEGKVLGLPEDADFHVLHYRGKCFKKAGLDPLTPPKTWDEVVQYCDKMKPALAADKIYPFCQLSGKGFWSYWQWFYYATMYGLDLLKPGTWEPHLNSDAGVNALKLYKKLFDYCPPGDIDWGYPDVREQWLSGNVAMFDLWQCVGRQAYDPAESKISPMTDPTEQLYHATVPAGPARWAPAWTWTTTVYGIPLASDTPEAAFLWAAFLSSAQSAFLLGAAGTGVEAGHAVALSDPVVWRSQPSYYPEWYQLPHAWTNLAIMETFELEEAAGAEIYNYLAGVESDPKKALDRANKKWEDILRDAYISKNAPPPLPLDLAARAKQLGITMPMPDQDIGPGALPPRRTECLPG